MELLPAAAMTLRTPPVCKLNKFKKYNLLSELKTNLTRNTSSPQPLSQRKIEANLEQLKAHFEATGDAQGLDDIVAKLHPTVQGVYQLLQDQTKTIVAAIDNRADAIDAKLDQQMRIMRGQIADEDSNGMTDHQMLALNCQSVRSMQSQNIQLRARIKGVQVPSNLEERTKRLEVMAQTKASKLADQVMKKANIAVKKEEMAKKKELKESARVLKASLKKPAQKTKLTSYFKPVDKEVGQEVTGESEAVSRLFK
jgi:hypothetical protein